VLIFLQLVQKALAWIIVGVGIEQLVERPSEKPSAILKRVRVPDAATAFSPRVNFQCRLSYDVYAAPMYNQASTSVRTFKIPNIGSHTIVWKHEKTLMHTLIGMGGIALVATVSYPGKATRISRKGQW